MVRTVFTKDNMQSAVDLYCILEGMQNCILTRGYVIHGVSVHVISGILNYTVHT